MSAEDIVAPLVAFLAGVPRRYRLPPLPTLSATEGDRTSESLSTILAVCVERARVALLRGEDPNGELKDRFVEALAGLIHDAMNEPGGDPAVQALVLRHRSPVVSEFAALIPQASQQRRHIDTLVNAIAHPAKVDRLSDAPLRAHLLRLHQLAGESDWEGTAAMSRRVLSDFAAEMDESRRGSLQRLVEHQALRHLTRITELEADPDVQRYLALKEQNGPRSNSSLAQEQGAASRQRGAEVEAASAQALHAVAERLNRLEGSSRHYRVVTSMRVPAAFPADPEGAKSEWDTVLVRHAHGNLWDVCLLVEAKASIDAVGTDLPRLRRGLKVLAHADPGDAYEFRTREGVLRLRGASLVALGTEEASAEKSLLRRTVLYCCDVEQDPGPRLLSAAARMQLLSTPASVAYAMAMSEARLGGDEPTPDPAMLHTVWNDLLHEPRWQQVLNQYPTLRLARELAVHVGDLADTARAAY